MIYYIGVDIGATKIASALILGGKIVKKSKIATEANKNQGQILANIKNSIKLVWQPQVKGIGIGIAGQIDAKKGQVVSSPNFSKDFKNIQLQKIIRQAFKKPVLIENDANCFTLGEAIYGAGKSYHYIIGLTLGTGVGGGIVIDKKAYRGKNGLAGEIGHMTVAAHGLKCSCGQKGHLEAYASGKAMIAIYQNLTGQKKDTFAIESLARKGDKKAKEVFKVMNEYLAIGLANIINIFNPDIIVIGGSLAKVNILTKPAIKLAASLVTYPTLKTGPILISKLKDDAPLLGAVALFKNK